MKKIFVALMAVLVLASCGGDKKGSSSSVSAVIENIKTPGDYFLAVATIQDRCSDRVDKAKNADEIIDAVDELTTNTLELKEKILGLDFSSTKNMDAYESEGRKYAASTERLRVTLNEKGRQIEFTPEQQQKFVQVLQKMYNSVPQ